MLSEAGELSGHGPPLKGLGFTMPSGAREMVPNRLHIWGHAQNYLCPICRTWLLPQFLYHTGASEYDKVYHQAGTSLSSQNPGLGRRRLPQALRPKARPLCGHPSASRSSVLLHPSPLLPSTASERICFLVRACNIPSTLASNLTMDSQAQGSSSVVERRERGDTPAEQW